MVLEDSIQNIVTLATSISTSRPGVDRPYRISTVNLGGAAATGQTAFTWNQNLYKYINLSQVPNSGLNVLNRTLSYDFAQLPSGSSRNFDFNLTVPIGVPMNTLLSSTAVSQPLAGDDYPLNNYFMYSQVVTNSYDPNDKHSNLGRALTRADSTLVYTIQFQNTGNDTAYTVVIRDTLDANVLMCSPPRPLMPAMPTSSISESRMYWSSVSRISCWLIASATSQGRTGSSPSPFD